MAKARWSARCRRWPTRPTCTNPRRAVSGLDGARAAMILAVLQARLKMSALGKAEVYASTVGGMRHRNQRRTSRSRWRWHRCKEKPILFHTVVIGEVGLAGEVRPVSALGRRVAEAKRPDSATPSSRPPGPTARTRPTDPHHPRHKPRRGRECLPSTVRRQPSSAYRPDRPSSAHRLRTRVLRPGVGRCVNSRRGRRSVCADRSR